jgi:hypothetical protein
MSASKELQHDHADLLAAAAAFDERFPLPLRILCLISAGVLLFASNLHVLSAFGIDTAAVLDVRGDVLPLGQSASSPISASGSAFVHPSKLYKPIYTLAAVYFAWTALAWLLFSLYGDAFSSASSKYMPAAFALIGVLLVFLPTERLQKRERYMFKRCGRRGAQSAD